MVEVRSALSGEMEYAPEDLTAVIPAGLTLGDVNDVLARSGQHLPIDPPHAPGATLGGALAAGVGGPLRSRYGLPRDLVLGMTVLRADGEFVHAGGRVVKNVTGYDLMRAWTGSLGTLGIITSVAVRVLPLPETTDLECDVSGFEAGLALADRFISGDIRPEYLDVCETDGRCRLCVRVVNGTLPAVSALAQGQAFLPARPGAYSFCATPDSRTAMRYRFASRCCRRLWWTVRRSCGCFHLRRSSHDPRGRSCEQPGEQARFQAPANSLGC